MSNGLPQKEKTLDQFLKEFSYIYFEDNYPFRDKEIEALTFDGAKLAFKRFLEQYRLRVQREDGTPDVKMWFYQAIDELEADLER